MWKARGRQRTGNISLAEDVSDRVHLGATDPSMSIRASSMQAPHLRRRSENRVKLFKVIK